MSLTLSSCIETRVAFVYKRAAALHTSYKTNLTTLYYHFMSSWQPMATSLYACNQWQSHFMPAIEEHWAQHERE